MTNKKRGLGRGLSALLGEGGLDSVPTTGKSPVSSDLKPQFLPVEQLYPNRNQPRKRFDENELDELARSIETQGILQPLLVRPRKDNEGYEIIAGERRWRAAQRARIHEVPVFIRNMDERAVVEAMLIENLQRKDLNPIEEAYGFQDMMNRFSYGQDDLASVIGKSRSHISNMMRLLKLPEDVQDLLRSGKITSGQARPLIGHEQASTLAQIIVEQGLSARDIERRVKQPASVKKTKNRQAKSQKNSDTLALEADLSATLNLPVSIEHGSEGNGSITISYANLDILEQLCGLLSEVGIKRQG